MRLQFDSRSGFTLLELAVTVVIIVILIALAFPAFAKLRARAQRVKCAANLHSLAAGAGLYLQDNGKWPQISAANAASSPEVFAQNWIDALAPYGITPETWICPTIENLLHNPDYTKPENARIDYTATPFDDKPTSPGEWPRQPWFVENADAHGSGNLIIFTDGSISDLKSVMAAAHH